MQPCGLAAVFCWGCQWEGSHIEPNNSVKTARNDIYFSHKTYYFKGETNTLAKLGFDIFWHAC